MALVITSWDARTRVVAMQQTNHACAAAAVADVLADLGGVEAAVGKGQIQDALIRLLGGLKHQGASLDDVAIAARILLADPWARQIMNDPGNIVVHDLSRRSWEDVLNLASLSVGVVIGLAPPSGQGEGHAVRLLGSDRPLRQAGGNAITSALSHPRMFTDEVLEVQYFDPDPTRPPGPYGHSFVEPHREVRARFEAFGSWALIISRR